jgi:selenocysteine-specific elongation factor
LLVNQGRVVDVGEGVVFSRVAYDTMTDKILAHGREKGKITLAEVRDMFNSSRKYVLPLLEYMDGKKLTKRVGNERVVR